MMELTLNRRVIDYLAEHSRRPLRAVRLWSHLLANLERMSNRVVATRRQLGNAVGLSPEDVSTVISELEAVGAVYRRRVEGRAIYYVNPLVVSRMNRETREAAQAEAPELRFPDGARASKTLGRLAAHAA